MVTLFPNKKSSETYIKLWRKAIDNDLFCMKPFDHWHAFEWMLIRARYTPGTVIIKNKIIHLEQGQLIISLDKLSKEFGWSVNKLIRYLNLLSDLKMCTHVGYAYGTLITIENYTKYQVDAQADEYAHEQADGKADGKHKKNDKECIKESISNDIDKKAIYGEFSNVKLTSDEYEKLTAIGGYEDLIVRLSAYKASTGKTYKSDYATILNWHRKDGKDGDENHRNDNSPKGKKNGTDEPVDKYVLLDDAINIVKGGRSNE